MALPTKEELRKMSAADLVKTLDKAARTVMTEGMKLRSQQTHEQKIYHANKKLVARIKTEQTNRNSKVEAKVEEAPNPTVDEN